MNSMNENAVAIGHAYYNAMREKNIAAMEQYLHDDINLLGPLGETKGKKAVIEAAKRLLPSLKNITIRAQYGSIDQAVLVYDMDLGESIGNLRAAALITLKDGLIISNELFFDAQPFSMKRS